MDNIRPIDWSPTPLTCLTIPAAKKEVILAVTQSRLGQCYEDGRSVSTSKAFDDFVKGKGREINILLQ